jgi:hypothetical protein
MRGKLVFTGLLSLAIIFGVFAQGIAYFLHENIWEVTPVYYLNVISILSVILFIAALIYVNKIFKPTTETVNRNLYYAITIMLAVPTTLWSFFVFAMWQG